MDAIHSILKAERKKKKITQSEAAHLAGVSQPQLSRFEKGGDVYLSTAQNIAAALDMRIIAVTKEMLMYIESLSGVAEAYAVKEPTLLDLYGIKDDE